MNKITRYEVCNTCRCALANDDCSGMTMPQFERFSLWCEEINDYLVPTDEPGIGDSCEACGYSDYEGAFFVVTTSDKG